ncbi:hypothetical protein L195_g062021, partial [Trifolium pratense]
MLEEWNVAQKYRSTHEVEAQTRNDNTMQWNSPRQGWVK